MCLCWLWAGLSTYLVAYSNSTLHFRRLAAKLSPAFSRHICPVQLLSESNVWKKKRNPHSNFSSRLGFSKEIDFLIDVTQFYLLRHSVRSRHTSKGAKRRTPDDSSPSPLMDFESFKPEFFEIRRFDVYIQKKLLSWCCLLYSIGWSRFVDRIDITRVYLLQYEQGKLSAICIYSFITWFV